jgi:hypothetical protein
MQQIILLALAVIIVGIATVYAIEAFTLNRTRSNMDALIQDAVTIGHELQQWKSRPEQFGGQPCKDPTDTTTDCSDPTYDNPRTLPADYSFFTWDQIGRATPALGALNNPVTTLNGEISAALTTGAAGFVLVQGCNVSEGNRIVVRVDGLQDTDINVLNVTRHLGDEVLITAAACPAPSQAY